MCKIRYRNSVHLKVLVSSFNLRGRKPRFCSGVSKENVAMSILVIPSTVTSPFRREYSAYHAGGLSTFRTIEEFSGDPFIWKHANNVKTN